MAFLNLCQSFWEKLLENIRNSHVWPFQVCTSLFGKNCQKKIVMAIFDHSKFMPIFFGKIVGKKCRMATFGHSKFIPIFLRKTVGKNLEQSKMAVSNFF